MAVVNIAKERMKYHSRRLALAVAVLFRRVRRSDGFAASSSEAAHDRVSESVSRHGGGGGGKRRRLRLPKTPWITCASSTEVRRAVQKYVSGGDSVLGIGTRTGKNNDIYAEICEAIDRRKGGRAVLMDVGMDAWRKKRGKRQRTAAASTEEEGRWIDAEDVTGEEKSIPEDVDLVEMETLDDWRDALWGLGGTATMSSVVPQHFDVLVLDLASMTGNDLELKTLSVAQEFMDHHRRIGRYDSETPSFPQRLPHTVIIKSTSITNLSRRLYHAQRVTDGVSTLSPPHKLTRTHFPTIVATVGVDEYRKMIPLTVRPGDEVAEVGCHVGTSTVKLHEAAAADGAEGFCIGFDIGPSIVDIAKRQYPHVPFAVGDAWRTAQLISMKGKIDADYASSDVLGYDVIYVDVGGLSGVNGLIEALALLGALGNACEPRCMVIKSECVKSLAGRLQPFSKIWSTEQELKSISKGEMM